MVTHILIPRFIQRALGKHNLRLSDIANFNKVKEVLSSNDIVLLQTLNNSKHWGQVLDLNVVERNDIYFGTDMSLYSLWYENATPENRTYLVNVLSVLVDSGQANDEIAERLFNNSGNEEAIATSQAQEPDKLPYEIIDIGPKYYGIIIEPNVFPNRDFSNKLIKDILKSTYIYCNQSEVARMELFRLYMGRL